jgi:hypothetical protein
MEEINNLETELYNGTNEFVDKTINIIGNGIFLTENSLKNIKSLSFHNCKFIGSYLEFEDINLPDFLLGFFNCSVEITLEIKNCNFKRLGFRDIKSNKSINLQRGKYCNFFFRNNNLKAKEENKLTGNISITNLIIDKEFELDYINHSDGKFDFSENTISILQSNRKEKITFENSSFDKIKFDGTKFLSETSFKEMEINQECTFEECEFEKVNFSHLKIGKLSFFDCKFFKTSLFHYIEGNISSFIKFESCLFEKYIQFNGTSCHKFRIDNVEFRKIVSFQETIFNEFFIDRTIFEKGALFDEIKIKNIQNCDRRTIRILKRELVNSHNQIDYLRFKAYELDAYSKESGKNWKDNLILYFNESSNYFGLDWTRGISFIFQWSFIFYLFYIISYSANIENFNRIPNIENFAINFLKFTNPLSFLNPPLEDSENYFLPLLFLILGKIFVSFGIYQTIQAFRKFGVNGG